MAPVNRAGGFKTHWKRDQEVRYPNHNSLSHAATVFLEISPIIHRSLHYRHDFY